MNAKGSAGYFGIFFSFSLEWFYENYAFIGASFTLKRRGGTLLLTQRANGSVAIQAIYFLTEDYIKYFHCGAQSQSLLHTCSPTGVGTEVLFQSLLPAKIKPSKSSHHHTE